MRNLITTIILLLITAYAIGQSQAIADGAKVLLVAGVASFGAYMVGYRNGHRERVQAKERSMARLAEVRNG